MQKIGCKILTTTEVKGEEETTLAIECREALKVKKMTTKKGGRAGFLALPSLWGGRAPSRIGVFAGKVVIERGADAPSPGEACFSTSSL